MCVCVCVCVRVCVGMCRCVGLAKAIIAAVNLNKNPKNTYYSIIIIDGIFQACFLDYTSLQQVYSHNMMSILLLTTGFQTSFKCRGYLFLLRLYSTSATEGL